jgi:hypothetical protein
MRAQRFGRTALIAAALGACSVDNVTFTDQIDASGTVDTRATIDAPPGALAIVTSSPTVTVTESQTQTFTVQLSTQPASAVLVTLSSSDDTKLGFGPTAVLFQPNTWDVAQTVTLTGRADSDTVDEQVTISLASAGLPTVDVAVTVADDDGLAFIVTPPSLDVTEGATGPLSVHLSAQPPADVAVTIASLDPSVATVAPGALTFTPANWNVDQSVTVTGVDDVDTTSDTTMVELSATGLTTIDVPVKVTDNDVLGISLSTTTLSVREGATTTFTVALTQLPAADTTVSLSSSDTGAAMASPSMLTFTTADWDVPQTVIVSAPQDSDTANESPNLSLSSTGLATRTVAVTVTDEDTQAIVTSKVSASVNEGGTTTINAHLAFAPTSDVSVAVTSLDGTIAMVGPATLTFTTSNYTSDQTVTISAPQDVDAADAMTQIRFDAAALGLQTDVPLTVVDDDVLAIAASTASVSLTEGGTATFQVHLTAQPAANVSVAVASVDPTAATASPSTLTFTAGNWNVDQTVTVSGTQDVDLAAESVGLTLTATGVGATAVTANVSDDDTQQIQLGAATLTVVEGQNSAVNVSLKFQPAANVTVAVASSDATAASVSPASLTFTPANYNVNQQVTVSGAQDADAIGDSATITLSTAGAANATVGVTVTDDDVLGLEANVAGLNITEGGTGQIGFRLTAQPATTTSVAIASSDTTLASASPTPLSFTTANWNVYQQVTVTGLQDANASDENVTVSASSTGLTTRTVPVTITDDDVIGITTNVSSVALGENGTATFTVQLTAAPASTVSVTVTSANVNKATVSPTPLSFSNASWNVAQTVTVTGLDDQDVANESIAITLSATGLSNRTVTAGITDDDTQVVIMSKPALTIGEGAQGGVGVHLRYQPAASVTVTVGSSDTAQATVAPQTLTFTTGNYATDQNVVITGVQDADTADGAATITASASGATSGTTGVTIVDDDVLGLEISTGTVDVAEGGSAVFNVRLTAQPAASTTVTVTPASGGKITAAPSPLTFTTTNWSTFQPVTVAAPQDLDAISETTSVTVASTGLTSHSVGVNVIDDEVQDIVVDTASVSLAEGGSATFKVHLAAQPTANLTVSLNSTDTTSASVSPTFMTFTTTNYATDQLVTITGVEDVDLANETPSINLNATGLAGHSVVASVTDNDTQAIVVGPGNLTVAEGGSGTINVHLAFQPSSNVTVDVSSASTTTVSVSPATLTFTPGNYASNQPVTVTGSTDADFDYDTTTVSFTSGTLANQVPITVFEPGALSIAITPGFATSVCELSSAGLPTATKLDLKLKGKPPGNVTVTVTIDKPATASIAPTSFTFTQGNFGVAQQITFAAKIDGDSMDDVVQVKASAAGYTSAIRNITVMYQKNPTCQGF